MSEKGSTIDLIYMWNVRKKKKENREPHSPRERDGICVYPRFVVGDKRNCKKVSTVISFQL